MLQVPNMFPYDERASINEMVRTLAKKQGKLLDTPAELWAYFVERTRANLHCVLCFSPIGDSFRDRLRQFPSLINCCTIDWWVWGQRLCCVSVLCWPSSRGLIQSKCLATVLY